MRRCEVVTSAATSGGLMDYLLQTRLSINMSHRCLTKEPQQILSAQFERIKSHWNTGSEQTLIAQRQTERFIRCAKHFRCSDVIS